MRLGMHLRELSRIPLGIAVSALIAAFAAVWSVASISLAPPRLTPRALDMATASAQVVVDTPRSSVVDLRQPTYDILPLKNRAILIGTLMASQAVRADIAARAGLSTDRLQVVAPRTTQQSRPIEQSGHKKGPGDLVASTDQFRLDVQANPTVPLLNIDTQAPSAAEAQRLANAAITGLGDFMNRVATTDHTPTKQEVRLRQLGVTKGTVINNGVQVQAVFVVFVIVFALSCAATVLLSRVRRGWRVAAAAGA
jgi:hypothetical protein